MASDGGPTLVKSDDTASERYPIHRVEGAREREGQGAGGSGRVLSLRSMVKFDILVRVGKLVESPPFFSAPLCAAPSRPIAAGLWCRSTGGRGNC